MKRTDIPSDHEKTYVYKLGQRIRAIREQQGLTQRELGKLAGVATDIISRLENGRTTNPGLQTLLKIADSMDTDISGLLSERNQVITLPEDSIKTRLWKTITRANIQDIHLLTEIAVLIARYRPTKTEPHS